MAQQVQIPNHRFTGAAFPWQVAALRAFDENRARFAHLICHRRARKSTTAINLIVRECMRHGNRTYRHIMPTRVQAKEAIWNDPNMLFSYLPSQERVPWTQNVSELTIRFPNGSRYVLDGADKISDKRRSIGGNGFVFDEWDFHESDYVYTGLVRPIVAEGAGRWCWFITTFNGQRHAYEMYNRALQEQRPDTYCLMLKASESGILGKAELADAKREMPLAMYLQEFECEPISSSEMVLIQIGQVERLKGIHRNWPDTRRIISIDPAFGGDSCVIMAIENTRVVEKVDLHPTQTAEIVGAAQMMGGRVGTNNFIVDNIGWGKGTLDGLSENPANYVQSFNASERPVNPNTGPCKLANKRAEAWWHTMDQVNAGNIEYPEDHELRRQLTSVCYKITSTGAVQIEDKDNVRKRIGRSPDDADAFVAGQWGLQNVEPVSEGKWREQERRFIPAGAGMGGMM